MPDLTLPLDRSGDGIGSPGVEWFYINPSDISNIPIRPRALYVGVAGDIYMLSLQGTTCVFKNVAVGYHPLRPIRILQTGTTASYILGLY